MKPTRRILRAAGTVGMTNLLSRVLGFLRDMVMAWYFSPLERDAFFVAFRIPNTMRRLFGEGAMVVSFVPVFTDIVQRDKEESKRVFRISMSLLTLALAVVVVLGIVFAKYIIMAFAPGFMDDPIKSQLTITLTKIMWPFLLFVSLVALAQGVLNALDHYMAPALAQSVHNLSMIVGAVWIAHLFSNSIMGLAVAVLIGGAAMLALQIPFLTSRGYYPRFEFDFHHPAVRRILYLMGPAAFGLLVYQFNMLASTVFASLLPTGSVSWLFYAQRFTELPLGIFAVAIGTAVLPTLSQHLSAGDLDGYRKSFVYSLNLVLFLMLPAMFGLMYMSLPIFSALFQRGEFNYHESVMSAQALLAYAPGLPFIAGARVTAPAFYARKDTRTPVRIAVRAFVINLVLSVVLMGPGYIFDPVFDYIGWRPAPGIILSALSYKWLAHVGLALATTISSFYNFAALIYNLQKKVGSIDFGAVLKSSARTALAGVIMLIPVWFLLHLNLADWEQMGMRWDKLLTLLGASVIGVVTFTAAAYALRQSELMELIDALSRRLKRRNSSPRGQDKPPDGGLPPPPPTE